MNIKWVKGYVNCDLTGKNVELFINLILKSKIEIWDLFIIKNEKANFSISIKEYFKLKPILKRSATRIHITEKSGLPFLLNRLKNRLGVIFAIILFIILIYIGSSIIWSIDIEGNKTIDKELIYQSLSEIGISEGTLKFKLPANETIKEYLQKKFEDASWVGVKIKGTSLRITIVEKIKPEEKNDSVPGNIISKRDAIIYRILAEKGIPQVKINDRVKKGDVLISGIIGNEEQSRTITAKGLVQGIVWYKSSITISLNQSWKEYTGEFYEQKYLVLGNRMIKIKGYDIIPFKKYHTVNNFQRVYFYDFELPFGILTKKNSEYNLNQKKLAESEAYAVALEQTKKNLCSKIGLDSKIINEKVISRNLVNDKLTLNILYEVVEDITLSQPITQGE